MTPRSPEPVPAAPGGAAGSTTGAGASVVAHADTGSAVPGLIGPNAILQYLPVLQDRLGEAGVATLLGANAVSVPDGHAMVDEGEVARLHQAVRRELPGEAERLARAAGAATADYIIANRIPAFVRALLAVLPTAVAEPMLVRAIARHAWTFAGSGAFRVITPEPLTFVIEGNPIVRGEHAEAPQCAWHCAVFERLFGRLLRTPYRVTEIRCGACGSGDCRFRVVRGQPRSLPAAAHGRLGET